MTGYPPPPPAVTAVIRGRRAAVALVAVIAVAFSLAGCTDTGSGESSDRAHPATSPSPSETPLTPKPAEAPGLTEPTGALGVYYQQELDWESCDDGFECATLTVPLDYDEPDGRTIEVEVVRLPAAERQGRVGSLVLNPGGPGGSGIEYARSAEMVITEPVRKWFDVVGFDPRGVGQSTPVDCLDDRSLDETLALDATPDTTDEVNAAVESVGAFAAGCEQRSGDLLPHIGTRNVARDLDVLRAALGDPQLYYLGKSYGTFIGATYAELFPERVGRLALDGALDPRLDGVALAKAQAAGFELALKSFIDWCVDRSDCPLGNDPDEALVALEGFLDSVDSKPLSTGSRGRALTQSLAVLGIIYPMYEEELWPMLRLALSHASEGKGAALLNLADYYLERSPDGRYKNNSNEVNIAVNCIDRPDAGDVEEIRARLAEFENASPLLGEYLAWGGLSCEHWPVEPVGEPHAIEANGAAPILVIGTTRDPATPYAWSEGLAEQLDSGVLLTYEGDGHTAYARGSDCIDRTVARYFLEGAPPADGTRCD